MASRWQVFLPPWGPLGLTSSPWRGLQSLRTVTSFVYWYGRQYSLSQNSLQVGKKDMFFLHNYKMPARRALSDEHSLIDQEVAMWLSKRYYSQWACWVNKAWAATKETTMWMEACENKMGVAQWRQYKSHGKWKSWFLKFWLILFIILSSFYDSVNVSMVEEFWSSK